MSGTLSAEIARYTYGYDDFKAVRLPFLPSPLLGCRPHCWLQPLFAPALRNPRDAGMRGGEGAG